MHSETSPKSVHEQLVSLLGLIRFAVFTAESFPLLWARNAFGPRTSEPVVVPKGYVEYAFGRVRALLEREQKNIVAGIYGTELLLPESAFLHLRRYLLVLFDSVAVARRSRRGASEEFSGSLSPNLEALPKYYRRNFHFQTDGYLSDHSAKIYGHQTEILFRGTLGLMRRVLLAPLISEIKSLRPRRVRVLELGCGTGEATKILLESCPNIHLTAVDLSAAYLRKLRQELGDFENLDTVEVDASQFLLANGKFDLVFSSYLFHELPRIEREKLLNLSHAALARGGRLLHIDSVQLGDDERLDWALEQFPKDFHEPFYGNYIRTSLVEMFKAAGFEGVRSDVAFLSKSVYGLRR